MQALAGFWVRLLVHLKFVHRSIESLPSSTNSLSKNGASKEMTFQKNIHTSWSFLARFIFNHESTECQYRRHQKSYVKYY
jgi:hypothetical protein